MAGDMAERRENPATRKPGEAPKPPAPSSGYGAGNRAEAEAWAAEQTAGMSREQLQEARNAAVKAGNYEEALRLTNAIKAQQDSEDPSSPGMGNAALKEVQEAPAEESAEDAADMPDEPERKPASKPASKPAARASASAPDAIGDIVQDSGGWSYKILADGRIQIVDAPDSNARARGDILEKDSQFWKAIATHGSLRTGMSPEQKSALGLSLQDSIKAARIGSEGKSGEGSAEHPLADLGGEGKPKTESSEPQMAAIESPDGTRTEVSKSESESSKEGKGGEDPKTAKADSVPESIADERAKTAYGRISGKVDEILKNRGGSR